MNDSERKFALNKLIILLILKEIELPLSKAQITNIVLENNLINYFDLQQCLYDLEKSNMIEKVENKEQYVITKKGLQTLLGLLLKIPKNIIELIKKYIKDNKNNIKIETQVFASYVKKSDTEYIVILKVVENDITLIELKINVVSAEQAKQICSKWKQSYSHIYDKVINILIK